MFEYFPANYIWSLGVAATLNSGGAIDEVDRACRPIREAAEQRDAGTRDLMLAWKRVADQVAEQAAEAEKAGHLRTAGPEVLPRGGVRLPGRADAELEGPRSGSRSTSRASTLMQKSFELIDPATTRVRGAVRGRRTLPAYFTKAERADGTPAPTMIMWNGLDSTKEHMYTSGWPQEMAARGISTLMVDCPGSGEALRFHGPQGPRRDRGLGQGVRRLPRDPRRRRPRPDRPGRLVARRLLRAARRGVREAAQARRRLGRQPQLGRGAEEAARARGREPGAALLGARAVGVGRTTTSTPSSRPPRRVNLNGVVEQITCPFLITHGENDRQINVAYAHQSYDQAVNSPQARAADLHARGGRDRARRARPPPPRRRVHGRLDRGHLRRARVTLVTGRGRADHRHRRWPGGAAAALFAEAGAPPSSAATSRRRRRRRTPVDLTDEDAVRRWVDAAAEEHGGIDILYANAGATRFGPLEDDHRGRVGLRAAARARRRVLPGQARLAAPQAVGGRGRRAGRLDRRASAGSMTNTRVAHTVTKGGIVALTKQLAAEGAPYGIRVNCVSPGMIETPATRGDLLADDHPMRGIAAAIPLGRVGRADEVARCALFLACDEASYVTGANLVVDGGWSAVLPGRPAPRPPRRRNP